MRLLVKSTRDFMAAITAVLIVTGIGLYFILQNELSAEMNEQLDLQADFAVNQISSDSSNLNPFLRLKKLSDGAATPDVYGDTILFDKVQGKDEGYHFLTTIKTINGSTYEMTVMTAHIGWEKYYETIFINQLVAFVMLGVFAVLVTYFSNKKLWRPFFNNLKQVQKFSVADESLMQLEDSNIQEFKELNNELRGLAVRAHAEYSTLREFTENASHEIQTPLGIAQSKLDRLSQMALTEEMAIQVVHAKDALERLSRTNRNLLLLAKLDNYPAENLEYIYLDHIIFRQHEMMNDLFATKGVRLFVHCESIRVTSDPYLSDILISNMLSNMLRYTAAGGEAHIDLGMGKLTFSNQGSQLGFPPEQLFQRFIKGQNHGDSTGLGLAIVKQICNLNNWYIGYTYKDGMHKFVIHFSVI